MQEQFGGNSYKQRNNEKVTEEKNIKPVTSNVTIKKQSEINKFGKKIFSEDAKSVGSHVIDSVVVPNIQKLITDIVKNAIDWLIYGVRGSSQNNSGIRNVSYSSYYDRNRNTSQPQPTISAPSVIAINEVIFNDRGEAEEVLLRLREILNRYGVVSVSEFYELIDKSCDFTVNKYGWRDLSNASVIRKGSGYCISFPKISPIE